MFGLGFQEIIVILLIALLLFGSKKLPQIGKSIGHSIKEFKEAFDGTKKEDKSETSETDDNSSSDDKK